MQKQFEKFGIGKNGKKNEKVQLKGKMLPMLIGVTIVLLVSNAVTGFLYIRVNGNADNGIDVRYPLLNPARNIYHQEDLIINFQPLRDYLNDTYEADSNVSIYFEYLPTGSNISINKDAEFYPASLLKVPITMTVAKKIERGEWKWT